MNPKTVRRFVVTPFLAALTSACGIPAKPVNDAASHISDTVAAGKAAQARCISDHSNCDDVTHAFDLIGTDAEGLKNLSAGGK